MSRFRLGLTGTIAVVGVMLLAMQAGNLPFFGGGRQLSAYFTEAGGLRSGSPVLVSGAKVGKVDSISIEGDHVRVGFTVTDDQVELGNTTRAAITTLTLLGKAGLKLEPQGHGDLAGGAEIPASRTSSPYDITAALSELTTRSSAIDVAQLSKALSTVSGTLDATPVDLDRALEGVTAVARSVSDNGATLDTLLTRTRDLTSVLQSRNGRVATLLTSGAHLLEELNARQQAVVDLLAGVTLLTGQLTRLIEENRSQLKPTLTELNTVTALLNRNRANLQKTIEGVRDYVVEIGDTLSSGPFWDSYVQNLTSPVTLAPVLSGMLR
ncbi:phospholipid/cholesterol/gamma-HCH transport system substrate-binding protein [Marmoricola sp. URHA0025 HA25]